ncbi:MAG: phosphatase PAP2 family protein [Thermoleophilaceae bacterium]|nr:phosphatase PAP2 family protein [Thermoleophilaceae bacterium]
MGTARKLAIAAVAAGVLVPPLRRRLRLPAPVVSVLAWQAPYALTLALPRTRARDAGVYALQMWAYFAHYQMPADDPDNLLERLKVRYPIRADEWMGRGEAPTIRLQKRIGSSDSVRPHDFALAAVHWAWFFYPHATVAYTLWKRPEQFPRAATLMAGTFDAGLLVYWLVPTAPPWWAAANADMPPVRRIMTEVGEQVWGRAWAPMFAYIGGNPFAAMPSLHFGTSVTAAHILSRIGRKQGAVGWAYAGTLGFALVYLGEHYVVDLLAGLGLAEGVRAGARLLHLDPP